LEDEDGDSSAEGGLAVKATSLIRSHVILFLVTQFPLPSWIPSPCNYSSFYCNIAIWWPRRMSIGNAGNGYLDFILKFHSRFGIKMAKPWPQIEDSPVLMEIPNHF